MVRGFLKIIYGIEYGIANTYFECNDSGDFILDEETGYIKIYVEEEKSNKEEQGLDNHYLEDTDSFATTPTKDYLILSFKDGDNILTYDKIAKESFTQKDKFLSPQEQWAIWNLIQNRKIHSIQRLSDGEIFSVGGLVLRPFQEKFEERLIYAFRVNDPYMNVDFYEPELMFSNKIPHSMLTMTIDQIKNR